MFGSIFKDFIKNNLYFLSQIVVLYMCEEIMYIVNSEEDFFMDIEKKDSVSETKGEYVVSSETITDKSDIDEKNNIENNENLEVKSENDELNKKDDIVKSESTQSKENEEVNKHDEVTETEDESNTQETDNKSETEEVVFASSSQPAVKRHSAATDEKSKKLLTMPVIAASVALIVVAAAGIAFAVNYNGNSAPAVVETQSEASQSSKNANISEKEESVVSALPVLRPEAAEIKTINTKSITFGDNVTVSGVDLSGKTLSEAYDAMQKRILEIRDDIDITVNCDGKSITLTQDDFSFDTDLSNALIQAYHFSRGELDKPTIETSYNDGITDFTVTSVVNRNSIPSAVKKVADKFDIQPVDAHVKEFHPDKTEKFTYADGSDGFLIDQTSVNTKLTEIIDQPTKKGAFSINTVKTPYKIKLADIKANTKLIASHYTIANNKWASVYNMELAIKSANGYVVNPGETFSFNTMTGDTTTGALGYVESTAIVRGEYENQYGGGICQASTTIYICALKADMEVVERHAHQYPSVYADRGLDATVDYGNLDMQFKNTRDYAIYIATYVYDYNGDGLDELCVEMYGPCSTEFDEIVPVGWVNAVASESYSAKGAKVYFKNGKEVKRELLPAGSYDYKYDSYYYASSLMPDDTYNGPKNVSPTGKTPTVLSPYGVGSSASIPYGTTEEYLKKNTTSAVHTQTVAPITQTSSSSN